MGILDTQILETILKPAFNNTLIPGMEPAESVTIRVISRGNWNPSSGATGDTVVNFPDKKVFPKAFSTTEVALSGGNLQLGDYRFKVIADSDITEMGTNVQIQYNGDWFKLIDVVPVSLGGSVVMWKTVGRKVAAT